MTMDDIESYLPVPRGESRAEVILWNAMRAIGHGDFTPPNRDLLKEALGVARQNHRMMEEVSTEFRARMKAILGILANCIRGEGEEHCLGHDLIEVLRGSE